MCTFYWDQTALPCIVILLTVDCISQPLHVAENKLHTVHCAFSLLNCYDNVLQPIRQHCTQCTDIVAYTIMQQAAQNFAYVSKVHLIGFPHLGYMQLYAVGQTWNYSSLLVQTFRLHCCRQLHCTAHLQQKQRQQSRSPDILLLLFLEFESQAGLGRTFKMLVSI